MADVPRLGASGALRREARLVGLLFAGATSMVGSGWPFGAYHASHIAGPLSIWRRVAVSGLGRIGGGAGVLGFRPVAALVAAWSAFVLALALKTALIPRRPRR
jgi:hypothetical protein